MKIPPRKRKSLLEKGLSICPHIFLFLISTLPTGELSAGSDSGLPGTLRLLLSGIRRMTTQSAFTPFQQQRAPANCCTQKRRLKSGIWLNSLATPLFLLKIMSCCGTGTQLEKAHHNRVINHDPPHTVVPLTSPVSGSGMAADSQHL